MRDGHFEEDLDHPGFGRLRFMPLIAAIILALQTRTEPIWQIGDALEVSRVTRGGRVPFSQDDVLGAEMENGFATAKAGDAVKTNSGDRAWTPVSAKSGQLDRQPPGGYVQAIVTSDRARDAILTVTGDGALYWNGEPRPGDVYGYGYLQLPVRVKAGQNQLLIASGRGALKARLEAPAAPQQFNLGDPTIPDVLTNDSGTLLGAVVVLNSTASVARGLRIEAAVEGTSVTSDLPPIMAHSFRKVPFKIPVLIGKAGDKQMLHLALLAGGTELDHGSLQLDVKDPFQTHRRTFVSGIDGSVQYYAVVPAKKPSRSNALVLTLHGAGVEAIGQANAYGAKDWCTIVAPTNRRPYGFDWEDIGRLDALEVLDIAKKTIPHDPRRVVLTGHSMGGHGTWSIGTLYPNLFAAIAPSAGWISFTTYAGGFAPQNPSSIDDMFLRAQATSDTLGRVRNTLEGETYILHGAQDDNVPVTEARRMKQELTDIGAHFEYHEQPGAGHWWGNQCVDWPPLFEMLKDARLKAVDDPSPIDFSTPNPAVSSTLRWATIWRQDEAGTSEVKLHVTGNTIVGATTNVEALELRKPSLPVRSVRIDGANLAIRRFPVRLEKKDGAWSSIGAWEVGWKDPAADGPLKTAFQKDMVFVVGTKGPDSAKLMDLARYLSESLEYRGNGAVDVLTDNDYLQRASRDHNLNRRNVVLLGNESANAASTVLHLGRAHISDRSNPQARTFSAPDLMPGGPHLATFFVCPHAGVPGGQVAALELSDNADAIAIARVPLFYSGPAFPDWCEFDARKVLTGGQSGIIAAGDFGPNWKPSDADTARQSK